jgi:hypothetical protein
MKSKPDRWYVGRSNKKYHITSSFVEGMLDGSVLGECLNSQAAAGRANSAKADMA